MKIAIIIELHCLKLIEFYKKINSSCCDKGLCRQISSYCYKNNVMVVGLMSTWENDIFIKLGTCLLLEIIVGYLY